LGLILSVSCSTTNYFENTDDTNIFIIVGHLQITDSTTKCKNNTIEINDKYNVIADNKGYFKLKINSDTCTITGISGFDIVKIWKTEKLIQNEINYIGNIKINILPKREIIHISNDYKSTDIYSRSQELYGPNSDYGKWSRQNCFDPSWDEIKQRGYYYSTPQKISEKEILEFTIDNELINIKNYFQEKYKNKLSFSVSLLSKRDI